MKEEDGIAAGGDAVSVLLGGRSAFEEVVWKKRKAYHHRQRHVSSEMGTRVDGIKGLRVLGTADGRVDGALSRSPAQRIGDPAVEASRLGLESGTNVDGEIGKRPVRDTVLTPLATTSKAEDGVKDRALGKLSSVPGLVPVP